MKNQRKSRTTKSVGNQQAGNKGKRLLAGIFLVGLGVSFLTGCSDKKSKQPRIMPAAPVTVETVSQKNVPVQLRAIGNVEAYTTVGIKAQAGGTLARVHFIEGQNVKKGSLLFEIDPRPMEASLRQAEAALARDSAQFENAKKDAGRYAGLVRKGYVSQEQYEQLKTNADALESVVQADMALVENAKIQLGYCSIHAPISGRTGSLLLHEGNLVKANADTPMVVIHQIQPVNVMFSVPEKYLPELRKYMTSGKLVTEAFSSKDDDSPRKGSLTFINNAVDPATGTIMMKASFPNQDSRLWPGQFVNVVITLRVQQNATVVPSAAIQTGQQGQFVYVVKGDTAELRPVTAGIDYEGITVVEKGIAPNEQVVTDGQMRLTPGARIAIRNGKP
ncbi:MAG: efflux RND transporter periplasmic adaptor subunit [Nitrospira bacterium HGW-Nitrospira-1]|nr:MAG: efflux RND transporter periplasmic adaptor subunit [Nitrospira bacterium HGW-Nitrospira-1]